MPDYIVTVQQTAADEDLHSIDQAEGPADGSTYDYDDCDDEDEALDIFHDTVPIKCLDDYEISVAEAGEDDEDEDYPDLDPVALEESEELLLAKSMSSHPENFDLEDDE